MKTKSEFHPVGGDGRCSIEQVTKGRAIKALYVVFDGQRIAYRGDRATWVSLVPGIRVTDNADLTQLSVHFEGSSLH